MPISILGRKKVPLFDIYAINMYKIWTNFVHQILATVIYNGSRISHTLPNFIPNTSVQDSKHLTHQLLNNAPPSTGHSMLVILNHQSIQKRKKRPHTGLTCTKRSLVQAFFPTLKAILISAHIWNICGDTDVPVKGQHQPIVSINQYIGQAYF